MTTPRYGTPNIDMLRTWVRRPAEHDGPFWALNLMQYRAVADYGDDEGGGDRPRSGKEADDAYAPTEVLADIGAMVALFGDVTAQSGGEPRWDRVGIVRYPTRSSFMAMQQRKDFQDKHVHKNAGMEFTIVMSCLPTGAPPEGTAEAGGSLVLRVARVAAGGALAPVAGATPVMSFTVEGVIVGDDRTWTHAVFDRAATDAVVAALATPGPGVEEQYTLTIRPSIDALVHSVETAPPQGGVA